VDRQHPAINVGWRHAFVLPAAVGRILRRSERDSRNRTERWSPRALLQITLPLLDSYATHNCWRRRRINKQRFRFHTQGYIRRTHSRRVGFLYTSCLKLTCVSSLRCFTYKRWLTCVQVRSPDCLPCVWLILWARSCTSGRGGDVWGQSAGAILGLEIAWWRIWRFHSEETGDVMAKASEIW